MENNSFVFSFITFIFSLAQLPSSLNKTGGFMTINLGFDSQESCEYVFFRNEQGIISDSTPFGQKT